MPDKMIIGSDHAGYALKLVVTDFLKNKGFDITDVGTSGESSCDYPDYSHQVAKAVNEGIFEKGIVICGSGNGVCMVANKYKHIRAALCWNIEIVKLARQHNNANILCLPARFIDSALALQMTEAFINTPFEGGRHLDRINKIPLK